MRQLPIAKSSNRNFFLGNYPLNMFFSRDKAHALAEQRRERNCKASWKGVVCLLMAGIGVAGCELSAGPMAYSERVQGRYVTSHGDVLRVDSISIEVYEAPDSRSDFARPYNKHSFGSLSDTSSQLSPSRRQCPRGRVDQLWAFTAHTDAGEKITFCGERGDPAHRIRAYEHPGASFASKWFGKRRPAPKTIDAGRLLTAADSASCDGTYHFLRSASTAYEPRDTLVVKIEGRYVHLGMIWDTREGTERRSGALTEEWLGKDTLGTHPSGARGDLIGAMLCAPLEPGMRGTFEYIDREGRKDTAVLTARRPYRVQSGFTPARRDSTLVVDAYMGGTFSLSVNRLLEKPEPLYIGVSDFLSGVGFKRVE